MKTNTILSTTHNRIVARLRGAAVTLASCQQQDEVALFAPDIAQGWAEDIGAAASALACWKLEGNATDDSGTSNGTVVGATAIVGINDQVLHFDGTDYVDIPQGRSCSGGGSISLWVRTIQTTATRLLHNTQVNPEGGLNAMCLGLVDGKPQLFFHLRPRADPCENCCAGRPAAPVEFIVDSQDVGFTTSDSWTASTGLSSFVGSNHFHEGDAQASPTDAATWTSPITAARAGTYAVYMPWNSAPDRPDAAPIKVNYGGGVATLAMNQRQGGGQWVKTGRGTSLAATATICVFLRPTPATPSPTPSAGCNKTIR